jgi:hypothetical protein
MSNLFEKPLSRTANSCMQLFRQGRFTMKRKFEENMPGLHHVFRSSSVTGHAAARAAASDRGLVTASQPDGLAGSERGRANTVLFATVLFFASASGKFEQRRVRIVAFCFAVAVFAFALARRMMLPR